MLDVVTLGETMAAFRADGLVRSTQQAAVSVAGSEGNVAVGLARLGHRVRWVGRVGDDGLGRLVRRTYAAENIDVSCVRVDPDAPTGILVSERRVGSVSKVDYHRRGSAGSLVTEEDVVEALACRPEIFHVSGITPALGERCAAAVTAGVREARRLGATVTFDVNYRARLWSEEAARRALGPLLATVDVVIGDSAELAVLVPGADDESRVRALFDLGVSEVVLKQGRSGATAFLPDRSAHVAAFPVPEVDPIGAGDAFVAGYLSGRFERLPLEEQLVRANMLGAFAVSTPGDWEGLPTRDELGLLSAASGDVMR